LLSLQVMEIMGGLIPILMQQEGCCRKAQIIQISQPAASSATTNTACPAAAFLTPQQKPLMLSAGVTKVADLRLSLQLQQPQLLPSELSSVLLALPPAWRTIVSSAPASTWFQVLSASDKQVI